METPLLYRQLQQQLRQWVQPKDQRHLRGFSEIVTGNGCFHNRFLRSHANAQKNKPGRASGALPKKTSGANMEARSACNL